MKASADQIGHGSAIELDLIGHAIGEILTN
jgi:hypothetical protein